MKIRRESGENKKGKVFKKYFSPFFAEREGFEPPEPVRFNGFQDHSDGT